MMKNYGSVTDKKAAVDLGIISKRFAPAIKVEL
jgi:hypothetical protein